MNDFLKENTEVEQQMIEQDKNIPDMDPKTFIKNISYYDNPYNEAHARFKF